MTRLLSKRQPWALYTPHSVESGRPSRCSHAFLVTSRPRPTGQSITGPLVNLHDSAMNSPDASPLLVFRLRPADRSSLRLGSGPSALCWLVRSPRISVFPPGANCRNMVGKTVAKSTARDTLGLFMHAGVKTTLGYLFSPHWVMRVSAPAE